MKKIETYSHENMYYITIIINYFFDSYLYSILFNYFFFLFFDLDDTYSFGLTHKNKLKTVSSP